METARWAAHLLAAPLLGGCGMLAGITDLGPSTDAADAAVGPDGGPQGDAAGDEGGVDGAGDAAEEAPGDDGGCDSTHPFGKPTQAIFGPTINAPAQTWTYGARLSPDQRTMYFTSQRTGNEEIYVATRSSTTDAFGSTTLVANVNAPSPARNEFASVSADGTTLVLTSDRAAPGVGLEQLYVARGTPVGPDFAAPVALTNVGSASMEDVMDYLLPDGSELYFARAGATGVPSDLYRSLLVGGTFAAPTPLTELNTGQEQHPVATPDDETLFYASVRTDVGVNVGALDIFVATRTKTGDPFGDLTDLPAGVNSPSNDVPDWVSPDGCTLYFSSDRNGGNYQLFVARRQ